ncbi:preprotein translocase subunit SecE [Patescibacteria group bacterium]|nr:preprotein translocase subunit SecE [Patescibacteria group bacterium]
MNAFIQYLRDVRAELTHVSWPTSAQAIGFTGLVIIIVIIVAVVLGAVDALLTIGIESIL